ncbi:unnamed protein product [Polarella glacialis]|uniref:Uncharacterized protein n=1 Tax=Polarella glacialis TaxID=89957 RepID=A0A813KI54_POLGL|nr:unnamed protein product [Polarella glacialis]
MPWPHQCGLAASVATAGPLVYRGSVARATGTPLHRFALPSTSSTSSGSSYQSMAAGATAALASASAASSVSRRARSSSSGAPSPPGPPSTASRVAAVARALELLEAQRASQFSEAQWASRAADEAAAPAVPGPTTQSSRTQPVGSSPSGSRGVQVLGSRGESGSGGGDHRTSPGGGVDRLVVDSETNFSRIYAGEEWGAEARSGLGSREDTTREFRSFLEGFLQEHDIRSVVDAGCGHWPTGYQRFMNWHGVHYMGVDVVPYVVEENMALFQDPDVLARYGLASAECIAGSVSNPLPSADLLMVKDVLMHLPNAAVESFLRSSVTGAAPKYRMILLVQNDVPPVPVRQMVDIEPGQLLPFDITAPPFSATGFRTIFRWKSDEMKVVQLWEP